MEIITSSQRIVTLSPTARGDLAANLIYTSQTWGGEQAQRYTDFLIAVLKSLAETPHLGRKVQGRKKLYSYIAKWRRARHGHRIIYQVVTGGIYVRRVLHTAMKIPPKFTDG